MDGLLNLLEENKRAVDQLIFQFLPKEHRFPEVSLLYNMMSDYPSRAAKGLRPTLCMITCEAFGGDRNLALPTAAALELFQNWILIHDDIEDDSDMRRGLPTLHRKYSVPLALNAGDALHARMWELLLKNRDVLGDRKTCEVIAEFSRMVNETTEGQHIELVWIESNRWDLGEEDYYRLCSKKTAWYTCVAPCRLGAMLAGASQGQLDKLIPFGINLGIAFQIRDDLLNLQSNLDRYGKEVLGDIWEGKRTLILIHLLKTCSDEEKKRILGIMNKKRREKKMEEVDEVFKLMKKAGSIKYAEAKVEEFAMEAERCFEEAFTPLSNHEAKQILRDLIEFMVKRQW